MNNVTRDDVEWLRCWGNYSTIESKERLQHITAFLEAHLPPEGAVRMQAAFALNNDGDWNVFGSNFLTEYGAITEAHKEVHGPHTTGIVEFYAMPPVPTEVQRVQGVVK